MRRSTRAGAAGALGIVCALALASVLPAARAGASGAALKAGNAAAKSKPAVPPVAAKPARPDFSGSWSLDFERSDFGKLPGKPKARTDVIVHRGADLSQTLLLVLPDGPDTTVYRYRADSTECENRVAKQLVRTRVWWRGDTLRFESNMRMGPVETSLSDRWTLEAAGTRLVMARRLKYPFGGGDQRLVFGKQK